MSDDLVILPQIGPWAAAVANQGYVYSSVSDYQLQPQRTKHWTKRNTLDQLSETWIGPAATEDLFVPLNGSVHPIYPLMTLLTVEVRRYVGNCGVVSQVTLNYHGKMRIGGGSTYVSAPTIDSFWSEGEVSWEVNATMSGAPAWVPIGQSAPTGGIMGTGATGVPTGAPIAPYYPNGQFIYPSVTGVQQWSRRYIGRCCRLGYITNKRPSGNPGGFAPYTVDLRPYTGFALVYDIRGAFQQGNQSLQNSQSIIAQTLCTDVNVSDSADGWYQVTETYQSRMYVQG